MLTPIRSKQFSLFCLVLAAHLGSLPRVLASATASPQPLSEIPAYTSLNFCPINPEAQTEDDWEKKKNQRNDMCTNNFTKDNFTQLLFLVHKWGLSSSFNSLLEATHHSHSQSSFLHVKLLNTSLYEQTRPPLCSLPNTWRSSLQERKIMGMGMKTPILSPLVPGPPPAKERARGRQAVDQWPLPPPSQCYFKHHLMFDAHLFGLICNILVQFLSSYKHRRSSSNIVSFSVVNIVLFTLSTF